MSIIIKDIKELVSREQIPLNSEVTATIFGGQADLYIGTITADGPNIGLYYCSKNNPRHLTIEDLLNVLDDKIVTIPSMDDDFNEIMEPATDIEYTPDSNTLNIYRL
jgi:hypothetical protein